MAGGICMSLRAGLCLPASWWASSSPHPSPPAASLNPCPVLTPAWSRRAFPAGVSGGGGLWAGHVLANRTQILCSNRAAQSLLGQCLAATQGKPEPGEEPDPETDDLRGAELTGAEAAAPWPSWLW